MTTTGFIPNRTRLAAIASAVLLAWAVPTAMADDWPAFKPGLWQFDRTMEGMGPAPQKVTRQDCIDPTADQKAQRTRLAKVGCVFSPTVQSGKTYRYSATCKMAGTTTTSNSVLEFQGTDAYKLTVDSTIDGMKTHEVLVARRVGDCPK